MEKQKNGELSRMFGYAGKFHVLTVLGCVLSGISTILSMLPSTHNGRSPLQEIYPQQQKPGLNRG